MNLHTHIGLALVAALVASTTAAATQQKDPDAQEIASYRLTMEGVNKVAAATRAMVAEMKKDPKFQELMKLDADIKALEKKEERTEAEDETLEQLKSKKEELSDSLDNMSMNDAKTLSDMEAQIRKFPPLMNALRSAGMTPREYSKFTLAMLQAGMVAGFKKSGLVKEIPKEVSAENVKFVEEHEAELKALQQEWEALGGK
jgi:hypothetical protein